MSLSSKYRNTTRSLDMFEVPRGQPLKHQGMTVVDLQAIREVIGIEALESVLRAAWPHEAGESIVEPYVVVEHALWARLLTELRGVYGQASPAILNRFGRIAFRHFVGDQAEQMSAISIALRLMPLRARKVFILRVIARAMNDSGQRDTVYLHEDDGQLRLIDTNSPGCGGVSADEPICWHTVGFIEEGLRWATSHDFKVEETACQAQGRPVCVFAVAREPSALPHVSWR